MIRLVPIDANDQLIECELDGTVYHVGLSWNEEAQRWTLAVRDLDRQAIVAGIALVPLWPLLRQVRGPGLPPGEIVADTTVGVIGRDSFVKGTASLFYVTQNEMAELNA